MKLNRTDAFWDRSTRNSINENWDIIEGSTRKLENDFKNVVDSITGEVVGQLVDNAKLNWKEPVDTFANLPSNPETGETRMTRDTGKVYRYDGAQWVEIQEIDATAINEVDSRLTARLADVEGQLTGPFLRNGEVKIPRFKLPFSVSKVGKRKFVHNATPYNQVDFQGATEIFISQNANNASGLQHTYPITLRRFATNYANGVYGSANKFVLTILDNVFIDVGAIGFSGINADILIRSGSPTGYSWLGRIKRPNVSGETGGWVVGGSVYKTTQSTSHDVIDVVNFNSLNNYGMPKLYEKVSSLTECENRPGTFFQSDATVYCNPHTGDSIHDCNLLVSTKLLDTTNFPGDNIVMHNIGFLTDSYVFNLPNINTKMFLFNCRFHRGKQDAFAITGKYTAYLFDCVADYASKDGFNYHTTDTNSLAVEINCVSYGNGKVKMAGGNTTTHSNNGSTAHDGMNMLRIGGRYWECEGPTVADVDDCYSISIGCEVDDMLPTNGKKAGFYFYDGDSTVHNPKYVIECYANGKEIEFGVSGTDNTYVMDFEGIMTHEGNIKTINWEEV